MNILELARWQWRGYSNYHRSRTNLLIHILGVPLFLAGNIGLLVGAIERSVAVLVASLIAVVASLAVQGRGHRQEAVAPEPFTSRANAIARILLEQWVTFPRFVLSGGWIEALRQRRP